MSVKFEDKIKRLDEAIELYSEGTKISAECKEKLEQARQKIENINDYTEE